LLKQSAWKPGHIITKSLFANDFKPVVTLPCNANLRFECSIQRREQQDLRAALAEQHASLRQQKGFVARVQPGPALHMQLSGLVSSVHHCGREAFAGSLLDPLDLFERELQLRASAAPEIGFERVVRRDSLCLRTG
jgi:hypothetical protein